MDLSWNLDDTFVGELVKPLHDRKYGEAAGESANLYFSHFLAAPLLPIGEKHHEEVKFCGNDNVVNYRDGLGAVIGSFIHATLVYSYGKLLFSDLQGRFGSKISPWYLFIESSLRSSVSSC